MNQQPDKLFRDKLRGYQPVVSSDAWKRVSGNLGQTSDGKIWMKIAAGLLLLAVAGILIFTIEKNGPSSLVAEKTPSKEKEESTKAEKIIPEQRQDAEKEEIPVAPAPIVEQKTKVAVKRREERKEPWQSGVTESVAENNDAATTPGPQAGLPQNPELKNSPDENNALAVDQENEKENITIVFTAQEVDEKYLKKKNVGAYATMEVKETSTWRKLLDKAYDLKHNQDPMGNLRQKKNEILALNFKNDKQSHENQ